MGPCKTDFKSKQVISHVSQNTTTWKARNKKRTCRKIFTNCFGRHQWATANLQGAPTGHGTKLDVRKTYTDYPPPLFVYETCAYHTKHIYKVFINVALATNNAVEPSRRATLNGLAMTLGSLAKAAGPAFSSAIFAWSIDGDSTRPFPLDYHLVFYLLSLR